MTSVGNNSDELILGHVLSSHTVAASLGPHSAKERAGARPEARPDRGLAAPEHAISLQASAGRSILTLRTP